MKSRRHKAQQFDLPVVGSEFNLRAEQTADGERITRERQQAEADRAEADKRQGILKEVRSNSHDS